MRSIQYRMGEQELATLDGLVEAGAGETRSEALRTLLREAAQLTKEDAVGAFSIARVHEVMREEGCDFRRACSILGQRSAAKRRAAQPPITLKPETVARKSRRYAEAERKRLLAEDAREQERREAAEGK